MMRYSKIVVLSFVSATTLAGSLLFAQHQVPAGQCVDGHCYPNAQNYGYYQNNWRRWPTMQAPPGSYGGPAFGPPAVQFQQQASLPANPRPLPSSFPSALPPQTPRNDVAAFQEPARFQAASPDIGPLPATELPRAAAVQAAHYETSSNAQYGEAMRLPVPTGEYVAPAAYESHYPTTAANSIDISTSQQQGMQYNPYCEPSPQTAVVPAANGVTSSGPGGGVMIQNPFANSAPRESQSTAAAKTVSSETFAPVTPRPISVTVAGKSNVAVAPIAAAPQTFKSMPSFASQGVSVSAANPLRGRDDEVQESPVPSSMKQREANAEQAAPSVVASSAAVEEVVLPPPHLSTQEPQLQPFRAAATPLPLKDSNVAPLPLSDGPAAVLPVNHIDAIHTVRPESRDATGGQNVAPQIVPALPPQAGGNPLRQGSAVAAPAQLPRGVSTLNPLRR